MFAVNSTREQRVAVALRAYLASGGTLERIMSELPAFKTRLQSIVDWMKSNAHCRTVDIQHRADRLGTLIRRKSDAVMRSDFDKASESRAEECALVESMGLRAPTGEMWHTVLRVRIEEQMRRLSALMHEVAKN